MSITSFTRNDPSNTYCEVRVELMFYQLGLIIMYMPRVAHPFSGAGPGFLKRGGVHLRSTSKKKGGGGPRGGPTLGPMLKSLHRGPRGGGGGPDPLPPWIRYCFFSVPQIKGLAWSCNCKPPTNPVGTSRNVMLGELHFLSRTHKSTGALLFKYYNNVYSPYHTPEWFHLHRGGLVCMLSRK